MDVYLTFAENLRNACGRFETISMVCEGIGINRQQFNKYLAGQSIPNALTLRKICNFLDTTEQQLLDDKSPQLPKRMEYEFGKGPFGFLTRGLKRFDMIVNEVPSGAYYCYFPMENMPGMLLRSLVLVSSSSRGTTFVRLTVLPVPNKSFASFGKGRHSGIVFANQSEIYFSGVNRYKPNQFSVMTIDKANSISRRFFSGVTITRSGANLATLKMCISRIEGQVNMRETVGRLGCIHESDNSIDPMVISVLYSGVK